MRAFLIVVAFLATALYGPMAASAGRPDLALASTGASACIFLYGVYRIGVWRGRRMERRTVRDEPATDRQRAYITILCRERDLDPPDMEHMTRAQASLTIDALKHPRDEK